MAIFLSTSRCRGQAPPTIERALRAEGVGLSDKALLAALQDPKERVRGMAAVLLAQHRYLPAIPALNVALQREPDPAGRLELAGALDLLGGTSGLSALEALCNDPRLPPDLRLDAAERSLAHGGGACAAATAGVLSASDNPAIQEAALYYLLQGRLPASAIDPGSADLQKGIHSALDSEVAAVRAGSAECIGKFRVVSERSHLLTVMQAESDAKTKAVMQKSFGELPTHE
jgi:hypothetical protein